MFKLVFALHLIFAIFAVGPLVHAATTAARGLRRGDPVAIRSSARTLRIYAVASVLVIVAGFALAATTSDFTKRKTADFGQTYIWLSTVLWVIAMAVVMGVLVTSLNQANHRLDEGRPVGALTARVAASGGAVAVVFVVIVALMVYRPGS